MQSTRIVSRRLLGRATLAVAVAAAVLVFLSARSNEVLAWRVENRPRPQPQFFRINQHIVNQRCVNYVLGEGDDLELVFGGGVTGRHKLEGAQAEWMRERLGEDPTFVKVSYHYINMSRLNSMEIDSGNLSLFFGSEKRARLRLGKTAAKAMEQWLAGHPPGPQVRQGSPGQGGRGAKKAFPVTPAKPRS